MMVGFPVSVLFGKTEVYQVHDVGLIVQANQEVVGFNVSVDVVPWVAELNSRDLT